MNISQITNPIAKQASPTINIEGRIQGKKEADSQFLVSWD